MTHSVVKLYQINAGEMFMMRNLPKHIFHKQKKFHITKMQHPDEGTTDSFDEWSTV